jgi:glycosyltransferase involved in cell wall biosynthesis
LFLVAEDWLFVQFRLPLAQELTQRGYEVMVACRVGSHADKLRAAGIGLLPASFARERLSPLAVGRSCLAVRAAVRQSGPALVQAVALRPILVGWLATLGLRRPPWINLVTGLGSLFTGQRRHARLRLARGAVELLSQRAFRHRQAYNVFQNHEDLDYFVERGFAPRTRCRLIPGSGVETRTWSPQPELPAPPQVLLFVGRLLRDKGLSELLAASRLLHRRGVPHVLRLVGDADPCNPSSLTSEELRAWQAEGKIEWLGWREDVFEQMSRAHVVVLPSYREGCPKALLEAGVAQRAVVTCDVPGCRELVQHEVNGLLVAARDPVGLADALERLTRAPELRLRLARAHRALVCEQYSAEVIHRQFLALYDEVLATGSP